MGSNSAATALQDLDRCESILKSIDQQLQSFRHWKALEQQLEPLQQARMHLAIAASASAVYQTLLRLRGPSPEEHAHAKELDRLETYKMKVTKVESEKWLQEHRPSLSVDVASANRFISAAIPELTPEQKHALRVAGRRHGKLAAEDHTASSSAAASQFLDSLATAPAPEDVLLRPGDKQRETTRRAALRDHLRISHPLSRKEKRRLAKEVQERDLLKKQKGH